MSGTWQSTGGINICAPRRRGTLAEAADSIRSRALDGRVARLVSRKSCFGHEYGPIADLASVASSQIRTLRTISVADLQLHLE
jgi:hypothetical protein